VSELAWPYLIVVVLCVFWLLGGGLQRRASSDGKKGRPHAAWRISEDGSPLRRFWQAPRRRRGG
jgi:hypothetical protein